LEVLPQDVSTWLNPLLTHVSPDLNVCTWDTLVTNRALGHGKFSNSQTLRLHVHTVEAPSFQSLDPKASYHTPCGLRKQELTDVKPSVLLCFLRT
jgi:hypothetical protein